MIRLSPTASHDVQRLESDRESLPFPSGGVFGSPIPSRHDPLTISPGIDAGAIIDSIDRMQTNLDTIERSLNAELARELTEHVEIAGRIGDSHANDWPPTAA